MRGMGQIYITPHEWRHSQCSYNTLAVHQCLNSAPAERTNRGNNLPHIVRIENLTMNSPLSTTQYYAQYFLHAHVRTIVLFPIHVCVL